MYNIICLKIWVKKKNTQHPEETDFEIVNRLLCIVTLFDDVNNEPTLKKLPLRYGTTCILLIYLTKWRKI